MWDMRLRTGREARRIAIAGVAVAVAIAIGGISLGALMVKIANPPIFTGPLFQASQVSAAWQT
jgi:hypothetical protein